jgi:hypothetical protein
MAEVLGKARGLRVMIKSIHRDGVAASRGAVP